MMPPHGPCEPTSVCPESNGAMPTLFSAKPFILNPKTPTTTSTAPLHALTSIICAGRWPIMTWRSISTPITSLLTTIVDYSVCNSATTTAPLSTSITLSEWNPITLWPYSIAEFCTTKQVISAPLSTIIPALSTNFPISGQDLLTVPAAIADLG